MNKHFPGTNESSSQHRIGNGIVYSASVQEALRYNKLRSSEYPLVMSILSALLRGHSEEQWKEEQQRPVKTLTNQPPDKGIFHADAVNRYEQVVGNLKDLTLWPW
jgi:hypothetical protein